MVQQSAGQQRSQALSFGALALFDLTGLVVYALVRHLVADRKKLKSATDTFQDAARLISQAHTEAIGSAEWDEERYALLRDRSAGERRA
jgi:hypothetical protein